MGKKTAACRNMGKSKATNTSSDKRRVKTKNETNATSGDRMKVGFLLNKQDDDKRKKEKKYVCEECGFAFAMRSNLTRHVMTVHEDRRHFSCNICGAAFGLKQNLSTHVRVKHEHSRPFSCDVCGGCFGYKQVLQNHRRNIHGLKQLLISFMWRKLRNRRRDRRVKPPSPPIPDAPPRPRTPSDSSPLITRSPSLPHSNPSPDVHSGRARTDIGTPADTSANPPRYAIHRPNPVHPEPPSDRNRRLSLDGDLPPSAIRPDDAEEAEDDTEALVDIQPAAFSSSFDVAGCSKAGWEPVRNHIAPVPPMHTVEVRKENQDAYCVFAPFAMSEQDDQKCEPQVFLGVFDGHGAEGRPIAHYARDHISTMSRDAATRLTHASRPSPDIHRARLDILKAAFSLAERALTESDSGIDHVFSGTTAVVAWLFGRDVYTAWTGDSRCVVGRMTTPENGRVRFKAVDLSHDQKPVRPDEKRRVRSAGGRIARWQRNMGPLRVWLPRDWTPGLAMTRSIGDTVLSEYGVSPIPEVTYTQLGPGDSFMVLASDGVWEFMTSQEVVEFVGRMRREGRCARESAEALVREAVRRWRRNEIVVDDTTAVVMWMNWEEERNEEEEKKNEGILTRPRKVFSMTKAKVSLKGSSLGVHLVCDDGHLTDFVCKNDVFQGI